MVLITMHCIFLGHNELLLLEKLWVIVLLDILIAKVAESPMSIQCTLNILKKQNTQFVGVVQQGLF